jgi:hypothetical protein
VAASPDRDVFFIFGSVCRVLAGKVMAKEWKTTVQDIWNWSLQTTRDLNGTAVDVPSFPQPASTTLPPPPTNGSPDPVLPPLAEKPVKVPDPAPIPVETTENPGTPAPSPEKPVVYLSDEQIIRFVQYSYKQGLSEMGLVRYLKTKGINSPSQIPLAKTRTLWNELQEPLITQQFK